MLLDNDRQPLRQGNMGYANLHLDLQFAIVCTVASCARWNVFWLLDAARLHQCTCLADALSPIHFCQGFEEGSSLTLVPLLFPLFACKYALYV